MLGAQIVPMPFRFGLAEGIDPHQAPVGTLLAAENVEWQKSGRLQKRSGVTALTSSYVDGATTGTIDTGSTVDSKVRLLSRGNELALIDGTHIYAYSETRTVWHRLDRVPNVALTWSTALEPMGGVKAHDVAVSDTGYRILAWLVGDPFDAAVASQLWVQVTDADGNVVVDATSAATTGMFALRVLVDDSQSVAYILSDKSTTTSIRVRALDLITMTLGTERTLRTDVVVDSFDAIMVGSNIVIVYRETAADDIKLYSYSYDSGTDAFTQVATGGITGEAGTGATHFALDGVSGEQLYVAYLETSAGEVKIATADTSTLAQITAPVTLSGEPDVSHVTVLRTSSTSASVGWSVSDGGSFATIAYTFSLEVSDTLAVSSNSGRQTFSVELISRLFALDGRVYAFATDFSRTAATSFQGTNSYMLEIEPDDHGLANPPVHRHAGLIDPLVGGRVHRLGSVAAVSVTEALAFVPFLSQLPSASSNWKCGLRAVSVVAGDGLPADMWRSVSANGESYVAGGALHAYDGRLCFDYGFPRAPTLLSTQTASPAASIGAGTYLYGFHLEYRGKSGNLHRSPTTTTTLEMLSGSSEATIVFATHLVSTKIGADNWTYDGTEILLPAYRSVANGVNYHRMTMEPGHNVLTVDPNLGKQTFTDGSADSDIGNSVSLSVRPLMYTAGGILDDEAPPNLLTVVLHRMRLWGVAGDKRTIWFSKSFQDDIGVVPGFSTSFRIVAEDDITALASMEEKLILFSAGAIWYLLGDGPAPNGEGSDLLGPNSVSTDTGCVNARSVVSTPDGVMFQGVTNGIYLLTRGLDVVWIGHQVQDQLDAHPNITSAVLVPKKNQVRFSCNAADGSACIVLVYDYVEKQWSTFKYLGGGGQALILDAILHDDVYTFVTTFGGIYQESDASYLDEGTWITAALETAWLSAAGATGFQRVRRAYVFGKRLTDCNVTMSVAVDGASAFDQARTWTADVLPDGKFGIHIRRQKSNSIRVRIEDATPTGEGSGVSTGQGLALSMIGFEIASKQGLDKRSAEARK